MPKALFTINTVVEVLADGALVTDSKNWSLAAAVADDLVNTWLGHMEILGLLNTFHGSLQDFSEDVFRLVLKLSLDEVLEGFAVHALVAAVFLGLFTKNLLDGLDWLRGGVDDLFNYRLGALGLHQDRLGLHLDGLVGVSERRNLEEDLL